MNWRFISGCARGTSHSSSDAPCQDSCFVTSVSGPEGELYFVAIASDGAGSAMHSAAGSEAACEAAGQFFCDQVESSGEALLSDESATECIDIVRKAIFALAVEAESSPREFACTILACIVGPTKALAFQIGDGAIVTLDGDGVLVPVFWPDSGEYANMTYFVTDDVAVNNLHVTVLPAPDQLAVLTDGLQRLALVFATKEVHAPFFAPMFQTLENTPGDQCDKLSDQLLQFLDSATINERTDDDKTLILGSRRTEPLNEQSSI